MLVLSSGTGGTSIINGISGLGGEGGQKSGVTTLAGGKAVFLLVARLTFPEVMALMGKMAP